MCTVWNLFRTKSNWISKYSNMLSLKIPRVRWKKEFRREGEVSRKVGDSFDPDRGGTNESPVVRHGD